MSTAKELHDEAVAELETRIREEGQVLLSEHEYKLLKGNRGVWRIRVRYDTTFQRNTLYWGALFYKVDVTQFAGALVHTVNNVSDRPPIRQITMT